MRALARGWQGGAVIISLSIGTLVFSNWRLAEEIILGLILIWLAIILWVEWPVLRTIRRRKSAG